MKKLLLLLIPLLLVQPARGQEEIPARTWLFLLGRLGPDIQAEEVANAIIPQGLAIEALPAERCGFPDAPSPQIAFADPRGLALTLGIPQDLAEDYVNMHRSYVAWAATGRGSWPSGCNSLYPNNHSATYYVDRKSFPDHMKRELRSDEWQEIVDVGVWASSVEEAQRLFSYRNEQHAAAAREAGYSRAQVGQPCNMLDVNLMLMEESYRRVGCVHIEVFTGPEGEHSIHIRAKEIPGPVIGYAYFNNGTCGDHVNHFIDSTWRPGWSGLAYLLTHETGHNNNLQHEFPNQNVHGSVMGYVRKWLFKGFSLGTPEYRPAPRDESMPELTAYYGGQPVPPVTPTPPGPEPPPVPPPIPTPGEFPYKIGDTIVQLTLGHRMELRVINVKRDDGPGLSQAIAEALTKVPAYDRLDIDRQILAAIYEAVSQAISSGAVDFDQGKIAVLEMRRLALGANLDKWKPVLDIADAATSAEAYLRVVAGLRGNEAISPLLVTMIKLIAERLPDGNFKTLVVILLTLLESEHNANLDHDNRGVFRPRPRRNQRVTQRHPRMFRRDPLAIWQIAN